MPEADVRGAMRVVGRYSALAAMERRFLPAPIGFGNGRYVHG